MNIDPAQFILFGQLPITKKALSNKL